MFISTRLEDLARVVSLFCSLEAGVHSIDYRLAACCSLSPRHELPTPVFSMRLVQVRSSLCIVVTQAEENRFNNINLDAWTETYSVTYYLRNLGALPFPREDRDH